MIDLGKWAFGHSKLVYFLLAVLLVGGLKSAYDMGKLEDPEVKVKIAMVVGVRPGASAHEMELEVTDPLEKAIRTVGQRCFRIGNLVPQHIPTLFEPVIGRRTFEFYLYDA